MLQIHTRHWPFLEWKQASASEATIGWSALLSCTIAAGTYSAFAKILTSALSPLSLFFISEVLVAFFILFSTGLMPMLRSLVRLPRKTLLPLLGIGLTSGTLAPLLLFVGLQASTAVNASLLGNTEMLFLIILAIIVLKEQFTKVHAVSIAAIGIGMVILALRGGAEGLHFYPGDILLALSGMVYAIGDLIFRKFLRHTDVQISLFSRSLVAIIAFFLLSHFLNYSLFTEVRALPLMLIAPLLGFALISRLLNVFSFYEAMERLPVTTVSLVGNLTVIISLLFAHWYLGEAILPYHLIGGAFIIAGMLLLEFVPTHPTDKHLEMHLKQSQ